MATIILSFAFSTATDMGWDPSIMPFYNPNDTKRERCLYQITVNRQIFMTKSIIQDHGADALIGRGARIFEVEGKDGRPAVLKDIWPDGTRKSEAKIYKDIIDNVKDENQRDVLRQHLMEPNVSGPVLVGEKRDHTLDVIMRACQFKFMRIINVSSMRPAAGGSL